MITTKLREAEKSAHMLLLTFAASAVWQLPSAGAETITQNSSGVYDDMYYAFWKDMGDASLTLHGGGRYTSRWEIGGNSWVGGIGWDSGEPKAFSYSGNYSMDEGADAFVALYGQTEDPYFEFHIVESHVGEEFRLPPETSHVGTFDSDGVTYDVYRWRRLSLDPDSNQYHGHYSIRRDPLPPGAVSGTITTANHFEAWASMNLTMTEPRFVIFATEGYQSSGSSDFSLVEVEPNGCGSADGMPVCCAITADPDGDRAGIQYQGQACVVTEDTLGWHPPNPDDVLAAINVGGYGVPTAIGDVWYTSGAFVSGVTFAHSIPGVSGAGGSPVYQSAGEGDMSIEIPVANATRLSVDIGVFEPLATSAESRVFDIFIEGEAVYADLDIHAEVGGKALLMLDPVEVLVDDGALDIDVVASQGTGTLSSVLVRKLSAAAPGGPASSSGSGSSAGGAHGWLLLLLVARLFWRRSTDTGVRVG